MNILGITVSDTLTFHHHISVLVAKSAHFFYVLKTICTHGLNGNAPWDVTCYSSLTTPECKPCLVGISQSIRKEPASDHH